MTPSEAGEGLLVQLLSAMVPKLAVEEATLIIKTLGMVELSLSQKRYMAAVLCHPNSPATLSVSSKSSLVRAAARQRELASNYESPNTDDLDAIMHALNDSTQALAHFDDTRKKVTSMPSNLEEQYAVDSQEFQTKILEQQREIDERLSKLDLVDSTGHCAYTRDSVEQAKSQLAQKQLELAQVCIRCKRFDSMRFDIDECNVARERLANIHASHSCCDDRAGLVPCLVRAPEAARQGRRGRPGAEPLEQARATRTPAGVARLVRSAAAHGVRTVPRQQPHASAAPCRAPAAPLDRHPGALRKVPAGRHRDGRVLPQAHEAHLERTARIRGTYARASDHHQVRARSRSRSRLLTALHWQTNTPNPDALRAESQRRYQIQVAHFAELHAEIQTAIRCCVSPLQLVTAAASALEPERTAEQLARIKELSQSLSKRTSKVVRRHSSLQMCNE